MEKDELIALHENLIERLDDIPEKRIVNPEYRAWRAYASRILERIWGLNSSHNQQFIRLSHEGGTHARAFLNHLVDEILELGGPTEGPAPVSISDIDWLINLFNKFQKNLSNIKASTFWKTNTRN